MNGEHPRRLKIHETTSADGSLSPTFLAVEAGVVSITSAEETLALPEGAVDAVMARFGKPLEASERVVDVGSLGLGAGRVLRHIRHLARYDVIARDYLVYEATGHEPICALATTVAGALAHLGRAAERARIHYSEPSG